MLYSPLFIGGFPLRIQKSIFFREQGCFFAVFDPGISNHGGNNNGSRFANYRYCRVVLFYWHVKVGCPSFHPIPSVSSDSSYFQQANQARASWLRWALKKTSTSTTSYVFQLVRTTCCIQIMAGPHWRGDAHSFP